MIDTVAQAYNNLGLFTEAARGAGEDTPDYRQDRRHPWLPTPW